MGREAEICLFRRAPEQEFENLDEATAAGIDGLLAKLPACTVR